MKLKFLASFLMICAALFLSTPAMAAFTNVVTFGDSISDNGAVSDPYGFGVYSNGTPWADLLATRHGATMFNVAFGGATTGWGNLYEAPLANPYTGTSVPDNFSGLQWQTNDAGIQATVGSMPLETTLFTVWAGANDYNRLSGLNALNKALDPSTPDLTAADRAAAATAAVTNITTSLTTLAGLGAEHILVPNMMLLGDGSFALTYNAALNAALDLFEDSTDTTIYRLDMFSLFLGMFNGYDITNSDPAIAAAEKLRAQEDGLLWTDGYHPGWLAHEIMAGMAFDATTVPVPGSVLLMAVGLISLAGIRREKVA